MITRRCLCLLVSLQLLSIGGRAEEEPASPNEKRVQEFVAAYNERDLDSLMGMVSEKIQWIYVKGDKTTVEATGKKDLRKSLTAFFKADPELKSELEWVRATSSRIAALERASWPTKDGARSRSSLSVYEFEDGRISKVYFFPPEE